MTLLVALLLVWSSGDEAVAREWLVRTWAAAPRVHAVELARELDAPRWRARAAALGALQRAAEAQCEWAEGQDAAVLAALSDAHPNVRERALAAAGSRGLVLPGPAARALAQDAVGSVRLALARALEFAPTSERGPHLARLAGDEDERVRAAARRTLLGLSEAGGDTGGRGVGAARLEALSQARAEGLAPFARFLLGLARSTLAEETLAAARARTTNDAAARGLIEALAFARFGRGDARALVAWAEVDEAWEGAAPALFELAANARSPALPPALWDGLADLAPGVARRGLVGLLLDALEPEAPAFLAAHMAGPVLVECLEALALRRDAWTDAEWAPWVRATTPPAVRGACQSALAGAYLRSGDASAGRGLLALLTDPDAELAARAFEALCAAREPGVEDGVALREAYARLPRAEKLRRTAAFTRDRVFADLRDEWLTLGAEEETSGAERAALCELLASFEGEAAVQAALGAWLSADLARFRAGAGHPEGERLVQAELRALARVSRGAARAEFEAGLSAALGRSTEVGKVAAAALGRTEAGRSVLAAELRAGTFAAEADRRTRIEACIVLAHAGAPEDRALAVTGLLADRTDAAWDLRQRMLEALADSGVAEAEAALVALLDAPELEPVERMTAATLSAARGGERVHVALTALARSTHDLESRRVALAGLTGLGAGATLVQLWDELAAGTLAGSAAELELLRGDLLVARARLDPGPWACAEWLRAPLARAEADLELRFRGEELPAAEFRWRHELELARLFAATGTLETCLERSAGLERLDARTLLALAESARTGGQLAAADALFAQATIALLGERDPDAGRLAWIHARRLDLAQRLERPAGIAQLEARVHSARRAGDLTDSQWETLFPDR